MGHRDAPSYGEYESLLQGCSAGNKPGFIDSNGSYTNWTITKNGSYYQISNSSYGTVLAAGASGNAVTCAASSNTTNYAKWSFEKVKTETFNNYWGGSYLINGHRVQKGEKIYIKVDLTESGSTSVYLNSILKKSDFNIVKQWNGLCNNIVIYGPDDKVPTGVNVFHISFEGSTGMESLLGKTQGRIGNRVVEYDEDWDNALITLSLSERGLGSEAKETIELVILHEFGHALKLAHPRNAKFIYTTVINGRGAYANDNKVCSIMNSGFPNESTNLCCLRAKWHDIINLKNKWG